MEKIQYRSIDEYHSGFPENVQKMMEELRAIIREAAPRASEVISYNMPAFRQYGVLVYYAAYKNHIGFYPTGSPIRVFKDELVKYKTSKGAIQFPIDSRIPKTLVKKIVKYRVLEDLEREKQKAKKKK
ncbi:MAG: DUF1801 domain-containing protein [Bacteroidia bacterium]|jgi:uncharacterized protein YdhG (YjbR/CyaY superfamily)